jgi:hypothetical protein
MASIYSSYGLLPMGPGGKIPLEIPAGTPLAPTGPAAFTDKLYNSVSDTVFPLVFPSNAALTHFSGFH